MNRVTGWLVAMTLPLVCGAAEGPVTRPVANAYFPLTPGTTWKYLVSGETNDKAQKPYVQTVVTGAAIQRGAETMYPIDGLAYATRADGVYVVGGVGSDGKVEPWGDGQRVISARPTASEAWNASANGESTYSTCLGSQAIKTEAGDFTTQCVFSSTTIGADGATQRSTYRYFARGVGLVRETVGERTKKPDGTLTTRETTRDLVAFTPVAEATQRDAAKAAEPIGVDAVSGELLDPSGQPVAQAAVTLRRVDRPESTRLQTSLSGRFSATNLDARGTYVLAVELAGYEPIEMPLRGVDGKPLRVEVRLKVSRGGGSTAGKSPDDLIAAGKALMTAGDARGALVTFSDAVAADPKVAGAHAYKALAHAQLRQSADAQRESEEALRLDPRDAVNWQIAGQVKAAMNQADQARGLFDKAASLAPERAGAIYMDLAAALAARNDAKLASEVEKALKLAAAANPPSHDALFQLGQGYANAGKAEGKAYLQRYLDATAKLPEAERDAQKVQVAKQMIRALDILNATKGK